MAIMAKIDREQMLRDVAAAIEVAKEGGKVAVVGYCLGGTVAWAAAGRLSGLSAAVGYYGGGIIGLNDLKPRVPTLLHFGEKDQHIPLVGVREVAAAHPDVEVHIYPADHGFNCDHRESYDAPSAALAWTRTLTLLAQALGRLAHLTGASQKSSVPIPSRRSSAPATVVHSRDDGSPSGQAIKGEPERLSPPSLLLDR